MKRLPLTLGMVVTAVALCTGCGDTAEDNKAAVENEISNEAAAAGDNDDVSIPNPMKETDADGTMQTLGVRFGVPDGAENVRYYIIDDEMAQMSFVLDSTEFTARIKPSAEFEDISGMYYDWNAVDDSWKVGYCDAKAMSYISETEDDAMVLLWYDVTPGLMYSISAVSGDLDGLDLSVYADQVYIPVQGDSDGDVIDTEVDSSLPPYQYYGDDKQAGAVAAFMANLGTDGYYSEEGSVVIPAPVIIQKVTDDDGKIKVYGNFWVFTYVPDGSTLSCISGGEYPGIITLEKSGDDYTVADAEFAGDGSEYMKDIKRFCDGNASMEELYLDASNADNASVKNIRIKYIFDYLNGNGLDTDYDSFQDYGWDPVYLSEAANWDGIEEAN